MKTTLWKLQGGYEVVDIDNRFYMVKFDKEEDRNKVIEGQL